MKTTVILEDRADNLALRPSKQTKLSWKETYAEMAVEKEHWSGWDTTIRDGLPDV